MSLFRCKMCGGTLELNHDETVGICEYCGTKQTLPRLGDEQKANLYDRANHLRRNNEYDKAMSIYEQILNADKTDAESYWSLVLCRYGIEYVEDPATHKRIPTVNRAQFTSVFADEDYKSAIQYADVLQKEIYEAEAAAIDKIHRGILEISQKEKPFDVFICYKETDANGRRTQDSVLATDLYHQLTQEGFKVFFSRITLEDKLGVEYEPYIFAALNSAKVMVVLGTRPEHFNAVWVRNEWSRYLALIKRGEKKMLIPAYRDMDPYDLPDEFSHLQAQDMSKLGFMQDLIRGIKKILSANEPAPAVKETVIINGGANANVSPLLRRAFIFLEDGDFASADEYCEKVLDIEPECAEAYLGKMMAELRIKKREDIALFDESLEANGNYKKALRFADSDFAAELRGYISAINSRKENARLEKIYNNCVHMMEKAFGEEEFNEAAKAFGELGSFSNSAEMASRCRRKAEEAKTERFERMYKSFTEQMNSAATENDFKLAAECFGGIAGFRDSEEMARLCLKKAEDAHLEAAYNSATAKMAENRIKSCEQAMEIFKSISAFKDSEKQIYACQCKIEELKVKEAEERLERERNAELKKIADQKRKENTKRLAKIWVPIVAGVLAFAILLNFVVIPNFDYIKVEVNTMVEDAKTEKAEKDNEPESLDVDPEEEYQKGVSYFYAKEYEKAISVFETIPEHNRSAAMIEFCESGIKFSEAMALLKEKKAEEAVAILEEIRDFSDTKEFFEGFLSSSENKEAYSIYLLKSGNLDENIFFGSYEQDNNLKNGKEPIEWIVVTKSGEKTFVLSRYALDWQPYSPKYYESQHDMAEHLWIESGLRKWLNEDFLNEAFDKTEQNILAEQETRLGEVQIADKVTLNYSTTSNTYRYLKDNERLCYPTAYAVEKGAEILSDGTVGWWSTRYYKAIGQVTSYAGLYVGDRKSGVRPMILIDTSKISLDEFYNALTEYYFSDYMKPVEEAADENPAETSSLSSAKVGDIITFGSYEQDNNLENGAEPIEWIVVGSDGEKSLLLSKNILDYKPFDAEKKTKVTWTECSLRKWLNNDFLNNAFNANEQKIISDTNFYNAGLDNDDKIFIIDDCAYSGMRNDIILLGLYKTSFATEYIANKVGKSDIDFWIVSTVGAFKGVSSNADEFKGVRPAMYIDLAAVE